MNAGRRTLSDSIERIFRRDRAVVLGALAAVVLLAAAYTIAGPGMDLAMSGDLGGAMMVPAVWSPAYAALIFAMWWIMMMAMMVPSAAPMVLLVAAVARRQSAPEQPLPTVAAFVAGYLVVWGAFSLAATLVQWGLEALLLVSPMGMASTTPVFAGILLVAAGIYQLTPLKHACLGRCRHPVGFVAAHWRPGRWGAFRMGLVHGTWCLGCCWALMLLLFVGGVMNLVWVAGIALFVLVEKTAPFGNVLGYLAGVALAGWGAALLLGIV
jgi:predicted metal-binding membrane protein